VKDLTADIARVRAGVDRLEALLERASRARTFSQAIDLVFEARRELADIPPRLAAIRRDDPPFIPPDPVAAAYFARRPPSGHLQD
jgi:hypothetical protein